MQTSFQRVFFNPILILAILILIVFNSIDIEVGNRMKPPRIPRPRPHYDCELKADFRTTALGIS